MLKRFYKPLTPARSLRSIQRTNRTPLKQKPPTCQEERAMKAAVFYEYKLHL